MRRLLGRGPVVFEGAQGVLLDEWHGLHPYTTWSTTTAANARTLLGEAGQEGAVLGVVRTYTPRHGPGPLPTEDSALLDVLGEAHNGTGRWQGAFRTGHFDAVLHRYAVAATGGVDAVALTHTDAPHRTAMGMCRAYTTDQGRCVALPGAVVGDLAGQERLTRRLFGVRALIDEVEPRAWPEAVAVELGAPVVLTSSGPGRGDKKWCGAPKRSGVSAPV